MVRYPPSRRGNFRQVAAATSHYRSINSCRNGLPLSSLYDVFSKWSNTKHKRKPTDYDPMQGTAGQGKTNAQLASIVRQAVQSTAFWREIDIFITVLEKIYRVLPTGPKR